MGLKNSDLACLSAKEALTQYLGVSQLVSLRRFRCWEINLNEFSLEDLKIDMQIFFLTFQ